MTKGKRFPDVLKYLLWGGDKMHQAISADENMQLENLSISQAVQAYFVERNGTLAVKLSKSHLDQQSLQTLTVLIELSLLALEGVLQK